MPRLFRPDLFQRLKERSVDEFEKARIRLWLKLRYAAAPQGEAVVSDCGNIRLLFHNDGDYQELSYHLNGTHWYEKERSRLAPWLHEGDTVVDVGANIGFMTIIFSELVGESGRVYAFEPSTWGFKKLRSMKEVNGAENVEVFNCGCSSQKESATLHSVSDSSGHQTILMQEEQHVSAENVRLVALDSFLEGRVDRVDLIKIDTEGYESEVLTGATDVLKSYKPHVYIELCQEFRESSEASIRLLKAHGYHFLEEPDLEVAHNGANFLAVHQSKKVHRNR